MRVGPTIPYNNEPASCSCARPRESASLIMLMHHPFLKDYSTGFQKATIAATCAGEAYTPGAKPAPAVADVVLR